jgi:hypothetical protein
MLSIGIAAYALFFRKRLLQWGTPETEARSRLPGDELVPDRDLLLQTTRSVTIRATPGDIWPWLAQMGQGRGGFYSYDWLENLFRMDIHNSDRILPEHQRLEVGDCIPFWKNVGVAVRSVEPGRFLVLAGSLSPDSDQVGGSWTFVLEPTGSQVTRLVVRARVANFSPTWLSRLFSLLLLEPAHFVMERKMLQGIQERAEAHRSNPLLVERRLTG